MNIFKKQWFLLVLLLSIGVSVLWPAQIKAGTNWVGMRWLSIMMLFLMSLPLDTRNLVKTACGRMHIVLLSVCIGFVVPPFLVWILPLQAFGLDAELQAGMAVAAAMPTTLSSAAIWTMLAGGDFALALLCGAAANFACIFLTPQVLNVTTGAAISFSLWGMTIRLMIIVILPTIVGQIIRNAGNCSVWIDRHRIKLGLLSKILILLAVLAGSARAAHTIAASGNSIGRELLIIIMLVGSIHILTLLLALAAGFTVRLQSGQRTALAFAASQKSLVLGLFVLSTFEPFKDMTVVILPIVVFHPLQLAIDSGIASYFKYRQSRQEHNTATAA